MYLFLTFSPPVPTSEKNSRKQSLASFSGESPADLDFPDVGLPNRSSVGNPSNPSLGRGVHSWALESDGTTWANGRPNVKKTARFVGFFVGCRKTTT